MAEKWLEILVNSKLAVATVFSISFYCVSGQIRAGVSDSSSNLKDGMVDAAKEMKEGMRGLGVEAVGKATEFYGNGAARAEHVSTSALLKYNDIDSYVKSQSEFGLIKHQLYSIGTSTQNINPYVLYGELNRLRSSPFFSDDYRPEYDAINYVLSKQIFKETTQEVKCADIVDGLSALGIKSKLAICDENKTVNLRELVRELSCKLKN